MQCSAVQCSAVQCTTIQITALHWNVQKSGQWHAKAGIYLRREEFPACQYRFLRAAASQQQQFHSAQQLLEIERKHGHYHFTVATFEQRNVRDENKRNVRKMKLRPSVLGQFWQRPNVLAGNDFAVTDRCTVLHCTVVQSTVVRCTVLHNMAMQPSDWDCCAVFSPLLDCTPQQPLYPIAAAQTTC